MNKGDHAASGLRDGFNCAQSVFSTFAPGLGLDEAKAAKVASAFGGGMARKGDTCGAVTGAFMTLGLAHGSSRPQDKEKKEKSYELAREFVRRFAERNGTTVCRDLLGCDIGTSEGYEQAKQRGLFDTVCVKLVKDAVEILEDMLSK
ncbi:MAG: C-GCAxxG-C-C family protein [Candidatus Krumholzibacteriaceae bacterium]|jgi:C_GCAxxG_C_C family probable redox protein